MNIKYIAAHPSNYTSGRDAKIDRIVIHYTGNDGDTAENNGKYFASPNRNASAHYFVDQDSVVQSVKEDNRAWHAGNREMNDRSIGIEMCSRKDANGVYYIPCATVTRTVELVQEIMAKYGIAVSGVIRHYDVNGKVCPEPFVRQPVQWADFKTAIVREGTNVAIKGASEWAKEACAWAVKQGIFKGDGKGNYNWQTPVTREQLAVILHSLHAKG